eukprot:CAMPEP_0175463616 /NCGR_PEP_ID=MMETSP0095-20121207/69309_1 /TAXON_ID=311494 /ORGANISM="Alexandrium monilatum, Strain CCMP3105" /LENGTH=33 /DNA_ID= /DNA_START= /DNA_END= /DNA_ORIENTATION=
MVFCAPSEKAGPIHPPSSAAKPGKLGAWLFKPG